MEIAWSINQLRISSSLGLILQESGHLLHDVWVVSAQGQQPSEVKIVVVERLQDVGHLNHKLGNNF